MQAALDSSVLFRLGRQLYAFSAVAVSEMVSLNEVHEVPDRAPFMRGVIDLRGSVLPVLDLRLRLGLPAVDQAQREVAVVVQTSAGRLAVVVDGVESVEALRERDEADDHRSVLASAEPELTSIRRRMKDDSLVVEVDVWQLMQPDPSVVAGLDAMPMSAGSADDSGPTLDF